MALKIFHSLTPLDIIGQVFFIGVFPYNNMEPCTEYQWFV